MIKKLFGFFGYFVFVVMVLLDASCAAKHSGQLKGSHSTNSDVRARLQSNEDLYQRAQRTFYRAEYTETLKLFEEYIEKSQTTYNQRERLFWVIDQAGRIYLREWRDPKGAIQFFSRFEKNDRLTEAGQDTVSEWVIAAQEWLSADAKKEVDVEYPDPLFWQGRNFFEQGKKKLRYPMDDQGNADFHIAASFLVSFITHFDSDPRIGEALLMMGEIRTHTWTDDSYWSQNFYLKEAIRRFPRTKIAQKAWKILRDEIHAENTGSGGDNTPPSLVKMLETYRKLAY